MIISLVGFMGTGKSSVGRLLADKLGYKFIDTDELIEAKSDLTISEIFDNHGERYFRKLEEEVLRELLYYDNIVLATGGGIVISAVNRKRLKEHTCPVLLQASPGEIYRRVDIEGRPLLANADNPCKTIEKLLTDRKKYYGEFEIKIDTDGKTKEQVVEEIIKITGVEKIAKENKC